MADEPVLICSIPGCGAKLRRSNTVGRCQEHRYINVARAVCAADGCEQPLRKDNRTGFCEPHKFAKGREPVRLCGAPGCGGRLRTDNTTGFCVDHAEPAWKSQDYRDKRKAEYRARPKSPDVRRTCSVAGCDRKLRSDNTTGRCTDHAYIPLDLPACSVDGCENRLTSRNSIGRCMEHRNWHADDAPKCGDTECGRTLHRDNRTGFCHKHRKQWRDAYNRKYYRRNRISLVEYARQYREAYPEEHRAASLRWERANPERKRANDAVFRDRNRERLRRTGRIFTRESYARHAARRRAESREYRARNPEKVNAAVASWRLRHPEFSSARNARRRARIKLPREDRQISFAYRMAIRRDPCLYCGGVAEHTDHYFPLVKGGTDHWWNLVRACRRCNLSKHARCGTAFLLLTGG